MLIYSVPKCGWLVPNKNGDMGSSSDGYVYSSNVHSKHLNNTITTLTTERTL